MFFRIDLVKYSRWIDEAFIVVFGYCLSGHPSQLLVVLRPVADQVIVFDDAVDPFCMRVLIDAFTHTASDQMLGSESQPVFAVVLPTTI